MVIVFFHIWYGFHGQCVFCEYPWTIWFIRVVNHWSLIKRYNYLCLIMMNIDHPMIRWYTMIMSLIMLKTLDDHWMIAIIDSSLDDKSWLITIIDHWSLDDNLWFPQYSQYVTILWVNHHYTFPPCLKLQSP
jgi:hypothetical protein